MDSSNKPLTDSHDPLGLGLNVGLGLFRAPPVINAPVGLRKIGPGERLWRWLRKAFTNPQSTSAPPPPPRPGG